MMVAGSEMVVGVRDSWWRRWLVAPVVKQLTLGTTPEKIAWTISLGVVLGVFPIMGSTTLVCILVGWLLRLNQPVLHVFKTLVYPLHLSLILVFIRLGEKLHGVPLISFSIPQLVARFQADPLQFARDFGLAAWHGVSAWLLIAPFAALLIKILILPVLRQLAASLQRQKEVGP
jgi:uncharacterized protein (DUF2062 family)